MDGLNQPRQEGGPLDNVGWHAVVRLLRPYGVRVAVALVALLVTAGASLSVGLGLRDLVDTGLTASNIRGLERALMLLLATGVVIAVGSYIRYYMMTWLGERVVADLRRDLFQNLIHRDVVFFEARKTGELLSRLTTDTSLLQTMIGSSLSLAVRNGIILLGGLVMMTVTSPKLAMACAVIVPVVVTPVLFFGRRVRRLSRESQDRVADVGAFAEESFNAIRTVKAFNQESGNLDRFNAEVEGAFATALRRTRVRSLLTSTVTIVVFCGLGAVLFIGGHDLVSGRMSPGELTAFLFYAVMVSFAAGVVSEVYGELQRARGALERIADLLQPTDRRAPSGHGPDTEQDARRGAGSVSLRGVSFHYASRPDAPALQDVSLDAKPGETVALVGPSGAGKSTIFQLILRFYAPHGGTIEIGRRDIRTMALADVRQQIALVPQEPFIFGTDAMENIRYGRPGASDEEVVRAAKEAMADPFISDLPEGYGTYLGEKGLRLSGGQKQRIAIARAILRDAPILLLDEATSALDSENERLVQGALKAAMAGRTTLVIAHRLATILNATRIVVLNEGRVTAVGRHEELMRTSALYRTYADQQLSRAGRGNP